MKTPRCTHNWSRKLSRIACGFVAIAAIVIGTSAAYAQQPARIYAGDSQEIRQSAESILSSPEFRYFKRLGQGRNPPGTNGGQGGGSGSGGSGGSAGSGSGSGSGGSTGSSRTGSSGDGNNSGGSNNSGNGSDSNPQPSNSGTSSPASSSSPPPSLPTFPLLGAALGGFLKLLAILLLLVVVGVIVFLIYKAVRSYDGGVSTSNLTENIELQGEIAPERPPGELPVDVYLAEARKLAAAGDYREAIAQLLLGAMSYVERAGLIQYRRGLTQRDYLRTLRSEKSQYQAMRTMVRVYEPLGFGRRDPAREHFEKSVAGYEQAFRAGMETSSS